MATHKHRFISIAIICLLLPAIQVPAWADWPAVTVDNSGDVGYCTSIAIDPDTDDIHITYFDETNDDLLHAYYDGAWEIETVDSSGDVGLGARLVLDSYGAPHIVYYDGTLFALKYAYYDGTWHSTTIDDNNGEGFFGGDASIALDAGNNPHVSYYTSIAEETVDAQGDDITVYYRVLLYANSYNSGTSWSIHEIDTAEDLAYTSLGLDTYGYPHISYYKTIYENYEYKKVLHYCLSYDGGSTWSIQQVDASNSVGLYSSLALTDEDKPRISYYDIKDGDLKYAYKETSGWEYTTVDSAGYTGLYTSLAYDSGGRPHISYYDETQGNLKYAYSYNDGTGWSVQVVDGSDNVGMHSSIALDGDEYPHISYFDKANSALKYATMIGANTPPIAIFDLSIASAAMIHVDATASTDAEDDSADLEVRWDWEGDGTWDTGYTTLKTASYSYHTVGTYSVTLEVRDSGGLTAVTSLQVYIASIPPAARFTVSPASGDTATLFTVDASSSSTGGDGAGTFLVRWDWTSDGMWDTSLSTAKTATHRFTTAGTYTVTLQIVDDGTGMTAATTGQLQVSAQNTPPAASFALSPALTGDIATQFTLDPSASSDAEDSSAQLAFRVDWGDGDGFQPGLAHSYDSPGTYTVTLEATDTGGLSSTAAKQVRIVNTPPAASFALSPALTGDIATQFALDPSGSSDAEDSSAQLAFRVDWGDGDGFQSGLAHSYDSPGTYTVTLEATDTGGLSSTAAKQVRIVNTPPAASFALSPALTGDIATQFTLDPSGSSDAEDSSAQLAFRVDWGDGDGFVTELTHTYAASGTYGILLEATDTGGLSATAAKQVLISGEPSNTYPFASFSLSPQSGDITTLFALDPSASSDAEDSSAQLAFRVDWGDGDGFVTELTHTYAAPGTYGILLEATDTGGLSATAARQVIVTDSGSADNTAPSAVFTIDPALTAAITTTFSIDPTGTSDGEDSFEQLSLRIDWGDGAGFQAEATHTYAVTGTFAVMVEAEDTGSLTATASRHVQVTGPANTHPVAAFTLAPRFGDTGTVFTLDPSPSSDAEDESGRLSFRVDWGEGSGFESGLTHSFSAPDTYTVTLEVSDTGGLCATATKQIIILSDNTPPTSLFNLAPPFGDTETLFTLDPSSSHDAEDTSGELAFRVDWGEGGGFQSALTHRYAAPGTYTITLEATDTGGLSATSTKQLSITAKNNPPTALFTLTSNSGNSNTQFILDPSSSADTEDSFDLLTIRVDWGDGEGLQTDFTHSYAAPGTYTVTLEVSDTSGLTATATKQVQIVNTPPEASFSLNPGLTGNITTQFSLDPGASDDAEDDYAQLTIRIDWGDGAGLQAALTHSYAAPGTYTVTLEVTDSGGLTATTAKQVQIINAPPTASCSLSPGLTGHPGTVFTMDPSSSTDAEDTPDQLSFRVDWGDGGGFTETLLHAYAAGGSYTLTLKVTDSGGLTDNTTKQVTVRPENTSPTPFFTVTPSAGSRSTEFTVNASGCADAEDDAGSLQVRWDWESDGTWDTSLSTAKTASHSYAATGTYSITLEVIDTGGFSATASQQVMIGNDGGGTPGGGGSTVTSTTTTIYIPTTTTTTLPAGGGGETSTSTSSINLIIYTSTTTTSTGSSDTSTTSTTVAREAELTGVSPASVQSGWLFPRIVFLEVEASAPFSWEDAAAVDIGIGITPLVTIPMNTTMYISGILWPWAPAQQYHVKIGGFKSIRLNVVSGIFP